jgi:putative hydroxymethylpyrimidine transport system permease protein
MRASAPAHRSTSTLLTWVRPVAIAAGLVVAWQLLVWLTGVPAFILPGPADVAATWVARAPTILRHAGITVTEIALGLVIGVLVGLATAVMLSEWRRLRPWLLPILVISQAIPVFALAPILVLWLGYGMASKVAMAALIIFFPVTSALYDGLRRVDPLWLEAARALGCTGPRLFRRVRLPAALPAFASGLRVATAVAPIGAVVGEWVGSSAGLGYLMLHANARLQIDLMFAALLTLALVAVALYAAVDAILRRAVAWQPGEADS